MPILLNSFAMDTRSGLREVALYQGDISELPSSLLVLSTHAGKGRPSGGALRAVEERYGRLAWRDRKRVVSLTRRHLLDVQARYPGDPSFEVPAHVYLLPADGTPWSDILLLRLPAPEYYRTLEHAQAAYRTAVDAVFCAAATLEQLGRKHERITLSVLGGAQAFSKRAAIDALLEGGVRWLERSIHTSSVAYTLLDAENAPSWCEAMNQALGRTTDEGQYGAANQLLRRELKERIEHVQARDPESDLARTLGAMNHALSSPGRMCVQHYAMFGRKVAEVVSRDICASLGLATSANAFANIEKLSADPRVSKWINSYMHSLRVLGNESVHVMGHGERVPTSLDGGDLLVVFTNALRV
ncbi:MAG: hypothetical protein KC492_30425, partial [Myxococcales bacterium]|nr:hypothetical protein [Myxococcales bacterium]